MNNDDVQWLHKFINCSVFGPSADDQMRAHLIVSDLAKAAVPEERRLISYESLQERCNELLDSLRGIVQAPNLDIAKKIAAITIDGDTIIWGEEFTRVPYEPTEAMEHAFHNGPTSPHRRFRECYQSMLDAAPKPQNGSS